MLPPENHLKHAILDIREPITFHGFEKDVPGDYNPEFLRWGPEKFLEIFGNKVLPFRVGSNARTCEPQWDVKCSTKKMTMSEFITTTESVNNSIWHYFDYKYMNQWFEAEPDFLKLIDWRRFGVNKRGNDSTLWIGSKGAHTNCHRDSYGCNLVAQLHGRKSWLLFPPDTGNSIQPTRVPYEESTIYSKFNFFCPAMKDAEAIMRIDKNARLVILEPGDVLLVPNGWWHYVESLDFSISINVWVPLERDHKERIKEALVKLLVSNIGPELSFAACNEREYTREEGIDLIQTCVDRYKQYDETCSTNSDKKMRRSPWTAQELAKEYPNSVKVSSELSRDELREFVTNNRERFPEIESSSRNSSEASAATVGIVDALCNYQIINTVVDLLIQDN